MDSHYFVVGITILAKRALCDLAEDPVIACNVLSPEEQKEHLEVPGLELLFGIILNYGNPPAEL